MNARSRKEIWLMGVGIILLGMIIAPLAEAATTAKTTFVFNVATNRGHTITYGGACHSSAFFFNEADANMDPDTDGNAMQIKPSPTRVNPDDVDVIVDYNFTGATSPRDKNAAYRSAVFGNPPSDNNTPSVQPNTAGYGFIAADDASTISTTTTTVGETASFRFVFRSNYPKEYVQDLNFQFVGSGQKAIDIQPCNAAYDLNVYFWNYTTSKYQQISGRSDAGNISGDDAQTIYARAIDNNYGAKVQDYIGTDRNVVVLVQGMTHDASGEACGVADYAHMWFDYFTKRPDFCQSETLAPMTITNVGNVDINVDGNFSSAFAGADTNLVLKVWRGTDSGCGTDGNGLGGWQEPCDVTTERPEALWEFNEGAGTAFYDSSGNGHHGTINFSTGWQTTIASCHEGYCIQKLAGEDYNVENNVTFLDLNFTISAWMFTTGGDVFATDIITTANGGGGNLVSLTVDASGDAISCQAGAGTASSIYDPGSVEDGWHHVVCTRKTDGNTTIFVDGTTFATAALTTGDLDLVGGGNSFIRIGYQTSSDEMLLDRISIYTRALQGTEITTLYNTGRATPLTWQTTTPTTTMCRQYDSSNATTGARLITKLPALDTNQLCFSGELSTRVVAGDHNKTFQTGSEFT